MANNKFTYWNEVWETNIDVANNRSIVHCKVYLKANGSGWQTSRSFSGNVNINGINHGFSWSPGNNNFPYASHNRALIAEFSDWVQHSEDGNLTVNVSSSFSTEGTYSPGYCSANNTLVCASIPRAAKVIGANNFTDEENPYMTINNPGGFNLSVKLEAAGLDPIVNRPNIGNRNNYTFELTDIERNLLREKCTGNSMPVRYTVITTIGESTFYEYVDRTMTIINANPIFDNFLLEDNNSNTIALTGNNQKYISGYSNVLTTITEFEKAIPQKYSKLIKYKLDNIESLNKENENITLQINNITNNVIEVYAIDSRGNSTKVTKNIDLIDYKNIVIKNIVANRNGVTQSSNLSFNGTFCNVNFGKLQNEIISAKYRYKFKNSSSWSEYIDILNKVQVKSNDFKFDSNIIGDLAAEGFSLENNFDIEVEIKDRLSIYTISTILQSAKPLMSFKSSKGVAVGNSYNDNLGGDLQVKNLIADNIKFNRSEKSSITCFSNEVHHTGGLWSDVGIKFTDNITIGDAFEIIDGDKIYVKKNIGAVIISANFVFKNRIVNPNAIYVWTGPDTYRRRYIKSEASNNESLVITENVKAGDKIMFTHYTNRENETFDTAEGCTLTVFQL